MQLGWRSNLYFLLGLYFSQVLAANPAERFDEELTLRPLRDGKNPETLDNDDDPQHYTLFPLALGQILREYAVTELHLSLNAGNWNYDRWGYPDEPGVGTGAELWVWMGDGASATVDQRWQGLQGSLPNWTAPHQLRHATLPSEHVCTENLTPFLKLLPCKSLSGIASLLNPHRVFDADWHGLGVHVRYREDAGVEVRLAFQAVFDPIRSSPDKRRDWSLRSIFDRTVGKACPVARSSEIHVELPREQSYTLVPDPSVINDRHATYVLVDRHEALDVAMAWPGEPAFQYPLGSAATPLTHLSVQRTLKGSSQSDAKLSVIITNNLPVQIQTGYLETMPWLAQFYLHTLRVYSDGHSRDDLSSIVSYTPPEPHSRPALLQAVLTLPPSSTVQLTMDVWKPFLRYTEHPPDAQRGWDLPPAVLVPFSLGGGATLDQNASLAAAALRGPPRRIYTPVLLVDLATPDFSMPYNVIIMSCTLIALLFGSVFNLLTRKFVVVRIAGGATSDLT
ncbi:Gpi16 subunit GPI transamidase component [Amylocystis lapponica]|nr:Gpi16 subunit GPI transamidase component [Amylocystis lapponica]